jgi:hypothetical protein
MGEEWTEWWRRRGEERLTLLLWAVWNPIGPVPLDEYESYAGPVATVLRRGHESDLELSGDGNRVTESVQRRRNKLLEATTAELSELLGNLRQEEMGMPPNLDGDRQAAETLLEWYEWEMYELSE